VHIVHSYSYNLLCTHTNCTTTGGEYSPGTAAARLAVVASSRQQRGGSGASGERDSSSAQLSESEKKVAAARSSGVSPQWRDIETVKKEKTAQLQRVRAQRYVVCALD
jgi:hypothetical protein